MCRETSDLRTFPLKSGVPKYGTPAKKPFCTNAPAPSTPAVFVTPLSSDERENGPPPPSAASEWPMRREEAVLNVGRPLWRCWSSAFEPPDTSSPGIGAERNANATLTKLVANATLMAVVLLKLLCV